MLLESDDMDVVRRLVSGAAGAGWSGILALLSASATSACWRVSGTTTVGGRGARPFTSEVLALRDMGACWPKPSPFFRSTPTPAPRLSTPAQPLHTRSTRTSGCDSGRADAASEVDAPCRGSEKVGGNGFDEEAGWGRGVRYEREGAEAEVENDCEDEDACGQNDVVGVVGDAFVEDVAVDE
jgi:hypothetical protein